MNAACFVAVLGMLFGAGPARAPAPSPADTPSGAVVSERIEGIRREEYSFRPVPAESSVWSAPNRAQGVRARISAQGLELFPRAVAASGADAPWRLSLRTITVRRGDVAVQLGEPTLSSRGATLTLSYGSVVEWFDNSSTGIEQSWRIEERVPGEGPLAVELMLGGGFKLRPSSDGSRATLVRGDVSLSYGGLRVWDATGRELGARIVATAQLTGIEVDDRGATYPVTIDPTLAWTAEGNQASAHLGGSVASAGDIDDDGFDDVLIGAALYDNGQTDEGLVFVYRGSPAGLSTSPAWTLEIDSASARFGASVAGAGRFDGDSFDDIVIGAPGIGAAYVYHGSANGPVLTTVLSKPTTNFGLSVAVAGDVDDDGFDDVIVGAPNFDTDDGAAYVFLGSATGLSTSPDSSLEPGLANAHFGSSVAGLGSVNDDNFDDVIVGAYSYTDGESEEGGVFVHYGSASGIGNNADWMAESNVVFAHFGENASGAGDVNGDGYDDVIVGAVGYEVGPTDEGGAFVYHGSSSGLVMPSGTPANADWSAQSNQLSAFFGSSVASAGDVNGDGYGDVIVGALLFDNGEADEGRAFVYLGSPTGLASNAVWTHESNTADARCSDVAMAGDVNGDGYSDLLVGADHFTGDQFAEGRAFLYVGVPHLVLAQKKISEATGGFQGPLSVGGDFFGWAVSSIGDVNGDGVLDVAVGARWTERGTNVAPGAVWILLLNEDGTVDSEVKIGSGIGGFTETLDDIEEFGAALAAPGDLDGDGVPDLCVGAAGNNDGGTSRGAVWILYLNSDGTVKTHGKISSTSVGFTGQLADLDYFGGAVEDLGDLDGAGPSVRALAVSAAGDDDGGANFGALWILFLDASETVIDHAKIVPGSGGFTGPMSADLFGASLAQLGDLDGPGGSAMVLAVGAPNDDEAGTNTGALWILGLNSGGGVNSERKITAGRSGFGGLLSSPDFYGFGTSIASLGPLDEHGACTLAVGLSEDDDAGSNAGAVWILVLDETGFVLGAEKITDGTHNLTGLEPGVLFGQGVGSLGDFDGDGRRDLVVGAPGDTEGGTVNPGAIWLLHLNDGSLSLASATTWTGATDDQWALASNWGNGVPDASKTAIIPDAATTPNDPRVTAAEACNTLWVQSAGTVEVAGAGELDVFGGATVSGLIAGAGELVFAAAGTIAGSSTIAPDVQADESLTVQGGPLALAGALTADQDITLLPGSDFGVASNLSVAGNLTVNGALAAFAEVGVGGTLFGEAEKGTLTIDSPGCEDVVVGQVCYGGFVVSNCSPLVMQSQSSSAEFDLADGWDGAVSISAPGNVVLKTAFLAVDGDLTIKTGTTLTVVVDCTIQAKMNEIVVEALATLDVTGKELSITEPTSIRVAGTLNIGPAGQLALGAATLTVEAGGKLNVDPDGELLLDGTTLIVEDGGTLCLAGSNTAPAVVAGLPSGHFTLDLQDGSTLAAKNFVFRRMASSGIVIDEDVVLAAAPLDLRGGSFSFPAVGGVLLDLSRPTPQEFRYLAFEDKDGDGAFNVRVPGTSAALTMTNWSGSFAGESDDDDPSNLLTWGPVQNTALTAFTAQRKPLDAANQIHLAWTTSSEVDCAAFVVERAIYEPAGPFVRIGDVAAAGPGDYRFEDVEVAPHLAYSYRLSERLTHDVLRELGEVVVEDVIPPPMIGKQSPSSLNTSPSPSTASGRGESISLPWTPPAPPPAPFQVGPGGDFATVNDALAVLGANESIELELLSGEHAPFEIDRMAAQSLCLAATTGAVIDASRASVRIAGLSSDQSVELAGLVIRSPEGHPGLVIEDCAGVVLLQDVVLSGVGDACALELSRARAVALQRGAIRGVLHVTEGSHASLNGTQARAIVVEGESILATSGPTVVPRVEQGSRWIASDAAPVLELDPLCVTVRAHSGRAWLLVGTDLGFQMHSAFSGVLLLDASSLTIVPAKALEQGCATWPLGQSEQTIYAQALVLEPLVGLRLSNVLRIGDG